MYHQIRKMIGVLIQIIQQKHNDMFIYETFKREKKSLYIAPAEGLLLNRISFEGYNKKYDIPTKILFSEDTEQKMLKFKEGVIY